VGIHAANRKGTNIHVWLRNNRGAGCGCLLCQAATATDASSARVPLDLHDRHHTEVPDVVPFPASPHVPTPPPPVDDRASQVRRPEIRDSTPYPAPHSLRCITFDSGRGRTVIIHPAGRQVGTGVSRAPPKRIREKTRPGV